MQEKIKNLIKKLSFFSLILLSLPVVSMAVSATFIGTIDDDGGDPYLKVKFEYGRTTSYGYSTPWQDHYGKGDFTATVSGLERCTTYHYRAVAKHRDYDDTRYGEDKTFTTPCDTTSNPLPVVDLKANGQDGTVYLSSGSSVTLQWTTSYANSCVASGDWSGNKALSGSETISNITSNKEFTLTCTGPGGTNSDWVRIVIQQVGGAVSPSIQKTVRNVSDGQTSYSESVYADPGEVLEFSIVINAGSGATNARIKDVLPAKLIFRQGSVKIDGNSVSGNILDEISLGTLTTNQVKTITYLVDVAGADQFGYGTTNLTNSATLYFAGDSISDSATVMVRKTAVAGATETPTGIDGKRILGIISPLLLLMVSGIFLFKSYLPELDEEWVQLNKFKIQNLMAKKKLERKIKKMVDKSG